MSDGQHFLPPVSVRSDPLPGTVVAGRFEVIERIATGAMGAVYRARQLRVGREIALKILRPERRYDADAKARFEREARTTSQLVSPNTVTAFDFGESDDGALFLAMELLEGETLGARLARDGRLPVDTAVRITREALASLGEAHAKGIIHRDLKPENLFLARVPGESGARTDVCKVLDFGIAKIRGGEGVDALETQAGTVFGTPRYMSPEQAAGRPLDGRSDLYALAVLLYQMLTGVPPFPDEDAVVVMARHIRSAPRRPSEVAPEAAIPPELENVVLAALAKRPEDQPADAEQLAAMLDDAMIEAARRGIAPSIRRMVIRSRPPPGLAEPDPLLTVPPPGRRTPWLIAGLAVIVAIGALASAALSWTTGVRPVPESPRDATHR